MQCFAKLRRGLSCLQIDNEPQADSGGTRKFVLPHPTGFPRGSHDLADRGRGQRHEFHFFTEGEIFLEFNQLCHKNSRSGNNAVV
jgi:hypothetical protein